MKRLDFNKIKQKRWLLDKNAKIFRIEEAREFVERLGLVSTFTNEHLPATILLGSGFGSSWPKRDGARRLTLEPLI